MTASFAALAGIGAASLARRLPHLGPPVVAGALAALVIAAPLPGAAGALALACWRLSRRFRGRRLAAASAGADVVLLADLVALGLGAGLSLPLALDEAAGEVDPALGAEVGSLHRAMDRLGVAAALAAATGRGERLYRLTARAAATGAPLAAAVEAFAAECRHAEHSRRLESARRLPVRLLLPLALLILPGFVVLVVGPALLESLARLEVLP
ncbi:MAG: type II secretion system F family protein [Actinomycetota bacterium]